MLIKLNTTVEEKFFGELFEREVFERANNYYMKLCDFKTIDDTELVTEVNAINLETGVLENFYNDEKVLALPKAYLKVE